MRNRSLIARSLDIGSSPLDSASVATFPVARLTPNLAHACIGRRGILRRFARLFSTLWTRMLSS